MQIDLFSPPPPLPTAPPSVPEPTTDWDKEMGSIVDLVEKFCDRAKREQPALKPHQVGCRVQLSAFGRDMQKPTAHQVGTVIDFEPWHQDGDGKTKGVVIIKWDEERGWKVMNIAQVEAI